MGWGEHDARADRRQYTRAELEAAVMMGAGLGAGVVMRIASEEHGVEIVMPTEALVEGLAGVMDEFDRRRGSALGFSEEQLLGLGRRDEGGEAGAS